MFERHPELEEIGREARAYLEAKHQARERALQSCRECIRLSANAIRAVHRQELDRARLLIGQAEELLDQVDSLLLERHADLYYGGFVQDAKKEFVEANATLAFVAGRSLPAPEELGVPVAAYLNGLAEAASELRRYLLDSLRRDETSRCEELMEAISSVYDLLVTMDFPDALTGGLRHATDALRGVLERTRADLTMALRQRSLEHRLTTLEDHLRGDPQQV